MGETKRQHYVPRTYLKRFTFDGTRLHTFLIKKDIPETFTDEYEENIHRNISMSDVCVSKDYYTLTPISTNKGMNPMDLEKNFFQDYAEPMLNEIIEVFDDLAVKFLEDKYDIASINISPEHWFRIVQATFIQYHRTPRSRHDIEIVNGLMKHVLRDKYNRENKQYVEDTLGLDVPYTHADKTYCNTYLFNMFMEKLATYSMAFRVSRNSNFFTSDNPVVIHKLGAKGKDILNVNFYRDEFSVFFPLTPYLILEFYNTDAFPDAKKLNFTISKVDEWYENQVNKYQYINAEKFVFSYKDDFSLFLKKK